MKKPVYRVRLLTDNLIVYETEISVSPPPFLTVRGVCYKRISFEAKGQITAYAQVVSEDLSNVESVAQPVAVFSIN